jgi:RNA polymerase sigma-70 factor, ECF subfamily
MEKRERSTEETESLTTQPLSPNPLDEVKLAQEAERVQRAIQGDQDALIMLYESNIDRVYRFFCGKVRSVSEAEALTSETFVRAIDALMRGHYEWRGVPFGAWLIGGIAVRLLQEHNRESKNASLTGPLNDLERYESLNGEVDILDTIVEQEERDTLWQLVRDLPIAEQQILVMRHVYNLPYAEIAKSLKRSEVACKQLHYRALSKLRDKVRASGLWKV